MRASANDRAATGGLVGAIALASLLAVSGPAAGGECVENPACEQHFPDSSFRRIDPRELTGLAPATLWEARNEIFARNGFAFTSDRARRHFGSKSYWRPVTSDVRLNAIEKANVDLIKSFEQGRAPAAAPNSGTQLVVTGLKRGGDGFLALRSGPGSDYAMIARLAEGTPVTAFGASGPWRQVTTAQGAGWAHSSWLRQAARAAPPRAAFEPVAPPSAAPPTVAPQVADPQASAPSSAIAASEPRSGASPLSGAMKDFGRQLDGLRIEPLPAQK